MAMAAASSAALQDRVTAVGVVNQRIEQGLDHDVLMAMLHGRAKVTVEDVMRPNVATVTEIDTLEEVAMLMYKEHRALVPVVDGEKLVGVVRRIHVLREIYTDE